MGHRDPFQRRPSAAHLEPCFGGQLAAGVLAFSVWPVFVSSCRSISRLLIQFPCTPRLCSIIVLVAPTLSFFSSDAAIEFSQDRSEEDFACLHLQIDLQLNLASISLFFPSSFYTF